MDRKNENPEREVPQIDEDALARAERLLKNTQNAIKNLKAELDSKEDQLAGNIKEVKRQAKVIGLLRQELDIAKNDIENYRNSTSWRITSPYRTIGTVFNHIFRRTNSDES